MIFARGVSEVSNCLSPQSLRTYVHGFCEVTDASRILQIDLDCFLSSGLCSGWCSLSKVWRLMVPYVGASSPRWDALSTEEKLTDLNMKLYSTSFPECGYGSICWILTILDVFGSSCLGWGSVSIGGRLVELDVDCCSWVSDMIVISAAIKSSSLKLSCLYSHITQ